MSDIKNKTGLYNSLNYIVLSKNELAQIHNFEQFKEIIELSFEYENIYQRYICIYNDSYSCSVIKSRKDIIDEKSCSQGRPERLAPCLFWGF